MASALIPPAWRRRRRVIAVDRGWAVWNDFMVFLWRQQVSACSLDDAVHRRIDSQMRP
jgi:hypothetical protein